MTSRRLLSLTLVAMVHLVGCLDRQAVLTSTTTDDLGDPTDDPPAPPDSSDADTLPPPRSDAYALSAGTAHSCSVVEGALYCWGSNSSGELGLGDAASRNSPARVEVDWTWLDVKAGDNHTCGVNAAREVYCWGANDRGQLGQGDRQSRSRPARVPLPFETIQLSTLFGHVCARAQSGETHCWGDNFEGQLAQGGQTPMPDNKRVADALSPIALPDEHSDISTGQGHTCGVRLNGSLWCWGRNTDAELASSSPAQVRTPVRIGDRIGWRSAHGGQAHSCAIRQDSTLWCWGQNSGGSTQDGSPLGLSESGPFENPTQITDSSDWTDFATNTFHSCGLRGDELWCWGRNIEGQLGLDDIEFRQEPTRVGTGFKQVSAGRFHTCVLTTDDEVQCTGKNDANQLGTGDDDRRRSFTTLRFE